MHIRDRIIELRRVRAAELAPHAKNWRRHPPRQQAALRGVLAEIGYAAALLARQREDGRLELIDGHLRAETTPDMEVPVLIVDLTAAEADKLLALHDPLAGMAETHDDALEELLRELSTHDAAVQSVLDDLARGLESHTADPPDTAPNDFREMFQVVVECDDEAAQEALYRRLSGEGFTCRLLTM